MKARVAQAVETGGGTAEQFDRIKAKRTRNRIEFQQFNPALALFDRADMILDRADPPRLGPLGQARRQTCLDQQIDQDDIIIAKDRIHAVTLTGPPPQQRGR